MFNDEIQVWNWVRNNGNEKMILSNPMKFYSFLSHRVSWLSRVLLQLHGNNILLWREKKGMLVHASIACRQHISKTQPFFLRQRSSYFCYICFLFSVLPGRKGAVLHTPHSTTKNRQFLYVRSRRPSKRRQAGFLVLSGLFAICRPQPQKQACCGACALFVLSL